MKSWTVDAEPRSCPELVAVALLVHLGAACLPWAVPLPSALAAALSMLALLLWPATLRALPGPHAALRRIAFDEYGWRVWPAGGRWIRAEVSPASRATRGLVVLSVSAGGRRLDWWLPRYALTADQFRHLKVAVLAMRAGGTPPAC